VTFNEFIKLKKLNFLLDCANKGECVAPDVCSCPEGFTGARCQQGKTGKIAKIGKPAKTTIYFIIKIHKICLLNIIIDTM
jgi:hypothetical protein